MAQHLNATPFRRPEARLFRSLRMLDADTHVGFACLVIGVVTLVLLLAGVIQ